MMTRNVHHPTIKLLIHNLPLQTMEFLGHKAEWTHSMRQYVKELRGGHETKPGTQSTQQ